MTLRAPLIVVAGQKQQLPAADWIATNQWQGKIAGAFDNGGPGMLMLEVQRGGELAPTPTNIGTVVARLAFFRLPSDLIVNKIRYYGVGATTTVFRVALYQWSSLARLTAELAFTTVAGAWGAAGAGLNITLTKDTLYFIACSANAAGAVQGPAAFGTTTTAAAGQIATAPAALPGNLNPTTGALAGYLAQMTVVAGALPSPAVAGNIVAPSVWTGGMPAFWLDNSNA